MPDFVTDSEKSIHNELRGLYTLLPDELVGSSRELCVRVRFLLTAVMQDSSDEIREGTLAFLGILSRAHELYIGGIRQLLDGNRHLLAMAIRGLLETFGAAAFIVESPSEVSSLIGKSSPNQNRLIRAGKTRLQGLGHDYGRLSKIVHPSGDSLLMGWRILRKGEHIALMAIPAPPLSSIECEESLRVLVIIVSELYKIVRDLIETSPGITKCGKHIGCVVPIT